MTADLLPILRSQRLSAIPGVVHGITRRVPGMSATDGQVGYSAPRDQDDAWRNRECWAAVIGVDAEAFVTPGQVHGNDVLVVTHDDAGTGARPGSGIIGHGDAMITRETGVTLLSLHADCLPILLTAMGDDGSAVAVGVSHAGWRGTVADVAGATISALFEQFGVEPTAIHAYLGPAIGRCCYDVGPEVIEAWMSQAPDGVDAVVQHEHGVRFDLVAANAHLLARAGVPHTQVDAADICTRCNGDRWFSHRAQGAETGRFAAIIALTDDRPDHRYEED